MITLSGRAVQRFLTRRLVRVGAVLMMVLLAGKIGWIEAKAVLAQHLLQRAWDKSLEQQPAHASAQHAPTAAAGLKPWPWFDSRPTAQLTWPDGRTQIILAGVSGQVLAFAPGMVSLDTQGRQLPGNARIGEHTGDHVLLIAAHNDTHFANLNQLQPGQQLQLQLTDGSVHRYAIQHTLVVDSSTPVLAAPLRPGELLLSTCYPFNTLATGSQQRYLVSALPLKMPVSVIGRQSIFASG